MRIVPGRHTRDEIHGKSAAGRSLVRFLQLFFNSLGRDPRPTRVYSLLRSLGDVTVCSAPPVEGFTAPEHFYRLQGHGHSLAHRVSRAINLLCRRYEADLWPPSLRDLFGRLKGQNFSAIICQDGLLVPLALALRDARRNRSLPCPVILDAREYYPRQFEQSLAWRTVLGGLNEYVCRTYFRRLDRIFTVSPGLARGYSEEYGLDCKLLFSCPYYHEIPVAVSGSGVLRCVHHGAANRGRKLELMVDAFRLLRGKAELDIMLVPSNVSNYEKICRRAEGAENIRFCPPVPMPDIVKELSSYDLGVYLLQDTTFNHRHCLPNKFFEYIQARLAIAISPLPDMAALVKEYDLGVISADFTPRAFAHCIAGLSKDEILRFKKNANAAAHALCWEQNDTLLRKTLLELMGKNHEEY